VCRGDRTSVIILGEIFEKSFGELSAVEGRSVKRNMHGPAGTADGDVQEKANWPKGK